MLKKYGLSDWQLCNRTKSICLAVWSLNLAQDLTTREHWLCYHWGVWRHCATWIYHVSHGVHRTLKPPVLILLKCYCWIKGKYAFFQWHLSCLVLPEQDKKHQQGSLFNFQDCQSSDFAGTSPFCWKKISSITSQVTWFIWWKLGIGIKLKEGMGLVKMSQKFIFASASTKSGIKHERGIWGVSESCDQPWHLSWPWLLGSYSRYLIVSSKGKFGLDDPQRSLPTPTILCCVPVVDNNRN